MRTLLVLFFFACSLPAAFSQNSCYNDLLAAGNKHLNAGRYDKAIQQYEAAKICGDKPANGEGVLKNKIAAARQQKKEAAERAKEAAEQERLVKEAAAEVERLAREEAARQEEAHYKLENNAWQMVLAKPTPLSYKYFMNKFPKGTHLEDAKQKILEYAAQFDSTKCNYCPELIFIKGGSYVMGDMEVHINQGKIPPKTNVPDFYISKYEVTNQQFCQFLNEECEMYIPVGEAVQSQRLISTKSNFRLPDHISPSRGKFIPEPGFENHPAFLKFDLSEELRFFFVWISTKTGLHYRLPTGVEWEYAARGGLLSRGYRYAGSNDPNEVAWYDGTGGKYHEVGQKKPNELGIFDMSGNLDEFAGSANRYLEGYMGGLYDSPASKITVFSSTDHSNGGGTGCLRIVRVP